MKVYPLLIILWQLFGVVLGRWPDGRYGLPRPKTGCPDESGWETGLHQQETEIGSHASNDNHLYEGGIYPSKYVAQHFCIKTTYSGPSDKKQIYSFLPGRYCLLMKGDLCPKGFQSGWIYWDDAAALFRKTIQYSNGTLPDGTFNRNTKIYYCCRDDGSSDIAIKLPTYQPFYLLKYGDTCQTVTDMNVEEEWIYWAGEQSFNLDKQGGLYPTLQRSSEPFNISTKLYYCYYTAKPQSAVPSNTLETFLYIVYFVCALFGFALVVAIILATVQRLMNYRQERRMNECLSWGPRNPVLQTNEPFPDQESADAYFSEMFVGTPPPQNGRVRLQRRVGSNPNAVGSMPNAVNSVHGGVGSLPGAVGIAPIGTSEESRSNERNKMLEAMKPPSYDDAAMGVGRAPEYDDFEPRSSHSSTDVLLDSDDMPPPAYDDVFGASGPSHDHRQV